jgi:hypothetical protein
MGKIPNQLLTWFAVSTLMHHVCPPANHCKMHTLGAQSDRIHCSLVSLVDVGLNNSVGVSFFYGC